MTAGSAVINQSAINAQAINATDYLVRVHNADILISVNKPASALINADGINENIINGIIIDGKVHITQTHIPSVNDAVIAVVASSPTPSMAYLAVVQNAYITVSCPKVYVEKGKGGNLFITVTETGGTVHRFSFEGVKA